MAKVVIDLSISLDGFIAGPDDGREHPLGTHGGEHIFDWFFGGTKSYKGTMFKPKGANQRVVAEMFRKAGVMLTGRRTYEITNGWNGNHPVNSIPIVVLTHAPPPNPPQGPSKLVFITDGIESAVAQAKRLAKGKDVGIGSASTAQQALKARLVDEIYLHVAPILLGGGVRLFDSIGDEAIQLRQIGSIIAEDVVHLHYKVIRRRGADKRQRT